MNLIATCDLLDLLNIPWSAEMKLEEMPSSVFSMVITFLWNLFLQAICCALILEKSFPYTHFLECKESFLGCKGSITKYKWERWMWCFSINKSRIVLSHLLSHTTCLWCIAGEEELAGSTNFSSENIFWILLQILFIFILWRNDTNWYFRTVSTTVPRHTGMPGMGCRCVVGV